MTIAVRYTATARGHVRRATTHYASIRPVFAARFLAGLDAVVENISHHPEQYESLNASYHRAFLDRFSLGCRLPPRRRNCRHRGRTARAGESSRSRFAYAALIRHNERLWPDVPA